MTPETNRDAVPLVSMQSPEHGPVTMARRVHDALNEPVLPFIPASARRILDIGCGSGVLGERIKQENTQCEFVGITLSPSEAHACRGRLDHVVVRDLNLETFRDLGPFDCIICSHALGYFIDTERILGEIRNALSPNGVFVAAIPNVLHWQQRVQFLRGNFRYSDGGQMDRYYVRFFDCQTAQEALRSAGFAIQSFDADGYLPLSKIRNIIGQRAARRWDKAGVRRFPGLFATQFVITARPQP